MKFSFIPHILRFKRPFSIAHGSRGHTPVVFTRLEHDGAAGYGEASMPPYLGETEESVLGFLARAKKVLEGISSPDDLAWVLNLVDEIAPGNTAAKASVDIALHDLMGKLRRMPCHEWFGADKSKEIFTAYTIAIDTPDGIKKRIEEANAFRLLKVKLGSADDKKMIEEIRRHTDKEIIVDANEGWEDKNKALEMIHWLAERKTLLVEQPMPKEKIDEAAWLKERSPLPIIADEAVKRFSDQAKAKGVYHGINVKLMKCTGLHEARKMIAEARSCGMKVMLGCMSESSCGVSAAAQLAPFADWVDLDGPLLIKQDYFAGLKFSEGKILLSDQPGIGVRPLHTLSFP